VSDAAFFRLSLRITVPDRRPILAAMYSTWSCDKRRPAGNTVTFEWSPFFFFFFLLFAVLRLQLARRRLSPLAVPSAERRKTGLEWWDAVRVGRGLRWLLIWSTSTGTYLCTPSRVGTVLVEIGHRAGCNAEHHSLHKTPRIGTNDGMTGYLKRGVCVLSKSQFSFEKRTPTPVGQVLIETAMTKI
jgi:hypothetical protein